MTTSPVHLAPSRSTSASATTSGSAAQSVASGGGHSASFDLLFALQLGADDGSIITPGEGGSTGVAEVIDPNAVAAEAPPIDPAQLLWNPLSPQTNVAEKSTALPAAEAGPQTIEGLDGGKRKLGEARLGDALGGKDDKADVGGDANPAPESLAAKPDKPALFALHAGMKPEAELRPSSNDKRHEVQASSATPLPMQAASTAPAAPVAQANLPAQVGTPAFAEQMAQQVAVFVDQKQLTAQVQVHPPELGPVDVQIKINAEQVQVDFFATQADTRDALETAIPRLKEMLAEQGLSLSGSNVGTRDDPQRFAQAFASGGQDGQRQRGDSGNADRGNGAADAGRIDPVTAAPGQRIRVPRLIDTFV